MDIFDLAFVVSYLGSDDPTADLTGDGAVDMSDLTTVAQNFDERFETSRVGPPGAS